MVSDFVQKILLLTIIDPSSSQFDRRRIIILSQISLVLHISLILHVVQFSISAIKVTLKLFVYAEDGVLFQCIFFAQLSVFLLLRLRKLEDRLASTVPANKDIKLAEEKSAKTSNKRYDDECHHGCRSAESTLR